MVKITACVIVKNEENHLRRWLDSMRRVTRDLVVVDTGSTDRSVQIARENGAKVYFYEWKDDFAAAKNFAIDKAEGDWILFLDADEYFTAESTRNVIRYIESYHPKKNVDALVCKIVNIDADDNNRFISEFYNLRMFRNIPELRYKRPVHEMLSRSDGPLQTYILPDGVEVYHTGYSNGIIEKKLRRNLQIILDEIAQKGEQRQHYRYLCECYYGLKEHALAEKYARLHITKGERSLGRDNSIHKRLIETMMLTRQDEGKIMAEIEAFSREFPDDPEFFWYKGELLFSKQAYCEAEEALLKFVAMAEAAEAQPDYGQSTLPAKLFAAYYPLGLVAEFRGDKAEAVAYYKKSLKRYRYNTVTLPRLLQLLAGDAAESVIALLDDIYADSLVDVKFIVKALAEAPCASVYEHYHARLRQMGALGDEHKAAELLAAKHYGRACVRLAAELREYYGVFLVIVLLQPTLSSESTVKALLPDMWRNVYRRFQGEPAALNEEETVILEDILARLPDANREVVQKRLRLPESGGKAPDGDALYALAAQAYKAKEGKKAEELAKQALTALTKYDAEALRLLGFIYHSREEYARTADVFTKALAALGGLENDFSAGIAQGLGKMNLLLGNIEQAKHYYLRAFEWSLDEREKLNNYSSYLLCCHYNLTTSGEALLRAHCKYQELLPRPQFAHASRAGKKQGKIRVGYISADFRQHVMSHFYYAFLHAYDKEKFFVACYALGEADGFTTRLRKLPDLWRDAAGKTHEETAAMIYADEIDILVDLGGHSANGGLPVLAYKPAPVQVSGLGYFNTTGMDAIDYFITDTYLMEDSWRASFVEKPLRLPHSHFCYTRFDALPASQGAPCRKKGFVTFGCFNQYPKITDEMLKLWKRILDGAGKAALVLKCQTFLCQDAVEGAKKRLEGFGFDLTRVSFEPPTRDYMTRYLSVDIALDTYPYQGGGTTCDALYMGVPVITLTGSRHGTRFGYSILKNIGLEELAVQSGEEYVERAVGLANDADLLELLHQRLRALMERSALMDEKQYMRCVEEKYVEALEKSRAGES